MTMDPSGKEVHNNSNPSNYRCKRMPKKDVTIALSMKSNGRKLSNHTVARHKAYSRNHSHSLSTLHYPLSPQSLGMTKNSSLETTRHHKL